MTTDRLWAAVHSITEPTSQKLERAAELFLRDDPELTVCDVQMYRAATLAYGKIPSLWDQATWALTGSEAGDGTGGRSPLRERSPADVDLMETMLTIRESLVWQLCGRGLKPRPDVPGQMRQLASFIARDPDRQGPDGIRDGEWWAYRFEQWARILQTQLRAVELGPRPVYLRGASCPLCRTRTVTIPDPNDEKRRLVVPALVVDFVNGWIRAAQCAACSHSWWRGADLSELAEALDGTRATSEAC